MAMRDKLDAAFDRLDRDWIGGFYAILALFVVGLAEATKLGASRRVQVNLMVALAVIVGFGIWYLLRIPDSLQGLFRTIGAMLGAQR